ncbi:MAG: enoyl-CoA hydratase/isomerase family protein [Anaerolineales bacterium]
MGNHEFIDLDQSDGVLTAALNRPKANVFDETLIEEWLSVLKTAARDDAVRCLVLTGTGRFFSAGQDVTVFNREAVSFREHLHRTYNRVIMKMHGLEKPIVGAINGPAVGAGLGVALATDLRVAAESASFIYGFVGIGLSADSGTSLALPRLIGLARSVEMAFTNRAVTAQEALDWGLVNQVVPDDHLAESVGELATKLAKGPTRAYGLSKRAINHASLALLNETLEYEAELQEIAGRTEDHSEGLQAFLDKREPKYQGK